MYDPLSRHYVWLKDFYSEPNFNSYTLFKYHFYEVHIDNTLLRLKGLARGINGTCGIKNRRIFLKKENNDESMKEHSEVCD